MDSRAATPPPADRLPFLALTSGGREVLKWLAAILMTGDHANKIIYGGSLPYVSEAARVVFPIFATVLAYNLVKSRNPFAVQSCLDRLLLAAFIAQPIHYLAFGYALPLNIMFTLALGVYCATAKDRRIALLAFVFGGYFVDYQWPGVFLVVALFGWYRDPTNRAFVVMLAAYASLALINANFWAFAALPLLWLLGELPITLPRWRWSFYAYYVAHLLVLVMLAWWLQ